MNASGNMAFFPELPFNEVIIVEFFFRQIQTTDKSFFRPTGLFIGTAFRAGFGTRRDVRSAVGTNLRAHSGNRKSQIPNPKRTPNPKHFQIADVPGIWDLEVFWDLGFGILSLIPSLRIP